MRVVQVLPDPRVGGPQIRVGLVGRALREHGIETIVVIPPGEAVRYLENAGLRCVVFDFPRPRRHALAYTTARTTLGAAYDIARLARIFRQEGADIVHVNGLPTIVAILAARAAGKRCVWHMNDTQTPRSVYRSVLTTARRARLFDRLVFSARAVAVHAAWPCSEGDVVGAPVEMNRYAVPCGEPADVLGRHYLDPDVPTLVMVGHINAIKGHEDLVDAVWRLRRRGISVQALCVGSAVDATAALRLAERIELRKLEAWFRLAGPSSRVEEYLSSASIFVLPSHTEAMPMSLLEAMAAGLPCVATRVGGIAEAIDDGVSGLLVPPRDPERLADAIGALLADPDRATRLGAAARSAVARFSVEQVAAKQAQIYREVRG